MGFAIDMHNLTLIVHEVLQAQRGGNHLTRRTEMIELTTSQREDGHLQRRHLFIGLRGVCAEGTAKLGIEVVFSQTCIISLTGAALRKKCYGLVAKKPHTNISQIEMVFLQFGERLHRRFLKHLLEHSGRTAIADEHAMILRHRGIEPETIAHHIGIGDGLQRLSGPDEYIATDHHRMQTFRSSSHHLLIKRQLNAHQILRKLLSPLPSEYGQGHQHLAADGIGRQTLALTSGMDQYALFFREPLLKRLLLSFSPYSFSPFSFTPYSFSPYSFSPCFLQKPDRTATTAKAMADRITRTEILVTAQTRHIMKALHQIRWQGQQLLHFSLLIFHSSGGGIP